MTDATYFLALRRKIQDSANIEVQLNGSAECQPIVTMLHKAKGEAAAALAQLATVNPENPAEIRTLQTVVQRFDDLCRWLSQIVKDGFDADLEVSEAERDELIEQLAGTEDGEQQLINAGLVEDSPHGGRD